MTPEEELLDDVAHSVIRSLLLDGDGNGVDNGDVQNESARLLQSSNHDKDANEMNADDADGQQGGQEYDFPTQSPINPTNSPTASPTTTPTASPTNSPTVSPTQEPTLTPTTSPTYYPTPKLDPWILKGTVWYDRNANGQRDSNVAVASLGSDVEYNVGLGGISTMMWSCATDTVAAEPMFSTVTRGVDATGRPGMTRQGGGEFTFTNIRLEQAYFIVVAAPAGYLFTSGVCNDAEAGWECDEDIEVPDDAVIPLGIANGRSVGCINVDRQGIPDGVINVGVMLVVDSTQEETYVALVFDFESTIGRRLFGRLLRGSDGRFLLGEDDKQAIGSVTAEVLAGSLDQKLKEVGVELDGVKPQQVILKSKKGTDPDQLAVALEVKGHYSPPPNIDFAFVVQESINAETDQIRRNLRDYNDNCGDQTSLINSGQAEGAEDFQYAIDSTGLQQNRPARNQNNNPVGTTYFKACSNGDKLPSIFETGLSEIIVTLVEEIEFNPDTERVKYVDPEKTFADWAVGSLTSIAGLIMLLAGAFVFRRATGQRKSHKQRRATQAVGSSDAPRRRRDGDDDASVDSAFYSDSGDDADDVELAPGDEYGRKLKKKCQYDKETGKKIKGSCPDKKNKRAQLSKMKTMRNFVNGGGKNKKQRNLGLGLESEPLAKSNHASRTEKELAKSNHSSRTEKERLKLKSSKTSSKKGSGNRKKGEKDSEMAELKASKKDNDTEYSGSTDSNYGSDDRKPAAKKIRSRDKKDKLKSSTRSEHSRSSSKPRSEHSRSRSNTRSMNRSEHGTKSTGGRAHSRSATAPSEGDRSEHGTKSTGSRAHSRSATAPSEGDNKKEKLKSSTRSESRKRRVKGKSSKIV